jgi:hypothetical protein
MSYTLGEFCSTYGDIIELMPTIPTQKYYDLLTQHDGWKYYNPRKKGFNRYGLSVTSMDEDYSGVPDLDSLYQYNLENNTNLGEHSFKKRTPIVDQMPEVRSLLDEFGDDLGRSHFLRLDKCGAFPVHRDHSWGLPSENYRVIVPFYNFHRYSMVWVYDNTSIRLREGTAYFMNTCKEHSLFSFVDNCIMLVLNIACNERSFKNLMRIAQIY